MIKIKDLVFTYPGSDLPVLNHVNLHIKKGEFVAIIGNNGCGKSTLCKTLNGLIPHFINGKMEGAVYLDNKSVSQMKISDIAFKVGYVYQDFENQIVCPTVLDDAGFACMNFGMEDYKERAMKVLKICGLEKKAFDYIWQLSGGQSHLLALAGMTALSPDILILDEPIAQLDPSHAKMIYEVLKDLNENHGKTIIVIEHHSEYIANYCHEVILMKNGSVEWKKPVSEALIRIDELQSCSIFPPQITIAAKKLDDFNLLKVNKNYPITIQQGINYFPKKKKHTITASMKKKNENKELMISFQDVDLSYRSVKGEDMKLFSSFNLDIYKGDKIALIGSNGAGKSSLMKLMVGLLKPQQGHVYIKGDDTKKYSAEKLSKHISLVYQNPEDMFIKDTIKEDIIFAMKERHVDNYEEKAEGLLELFDLTQLQDRDGRLMSGGQMRRASLAIGVALNPSILLLDEPTANLDIATRKEIMKTLDLLKDIVETVIIATHDMQLVCDWAKRILVLTGGKLIGDGSRDEIFSNQEVRRIAGIEPPEIVKMGEALNIHCFEIDEFVDAYREELC